jgi:hypothetical protein
MTMINKENKQPTPPQETKERGHVDTARIDVQCHLLIKDKDTGKTLVHKRG